MDFSGLYFLRQNRINPDSPRSPLLRGRGACFSFRSAISCFSSALSLLSCRLPRTKRKREQVKQEIFLLSYFFLFGWLFCFFCYLLGWWFWVFCRFASGYNLFAGWYVGSKEGMRLDLRIHDSLLAQASQSALSIDLRDQSQKHPHLLPKGDEKNTKNTKTMAQKPQTEKQGHLRPTKK